MTIIRGYIWINELGIFVNGECQVPGTKEGLDDLLKKGYEFAVSAYPKFFKMDRLSKLGWLATELLVQHFMEHKSEFQPEDVAIVLSNASASLDTDYKYFNTLSQIASPALFVYTLPNIVIGEICIRHGFKGENGFFVQETFDTSFTSQYIEQLLQSGRAKACIAGWVEVLQDKFDAFVYLAEVQPEGSEGLIHHKENLNNIWNN